MSEVPTNSVCLRPCFLIRSSNELRVCLRPCLIRSSNELRLSSTVLLHSKVAVKLIERSFGLFVYHSVLIFGSHDSLTRTLLHIQIFSAPGGVFEVGGPEVPRNSDCLPFPHCEILNRSYFFIRSSNKLHISVSHLGCLFSIAFSARLIH